MLGVLYCMCPECNDGCQLCVNSVKRLTVVINILVVMILSCVQPFQAASLFGLLAVVGLYCHLIQADIHNLTQHKALHRVWHPHPLLLHLPLQQQHSFSLSLHNNVKLRYIIRCN